MRPLALIAVAIAGLAVAAPSLLQRAVEQYEGAASEESRERLQSSSSSVEYVEGARGNGRQLAVRAERDGHFYIEADINLHPVRLVVDTGATVVALRESDAASAGIRVVPADFDQRVATANGNLDAAQVRIDSIALADIEVENVEALVLPDDKLPISLLGGSFLNRLGRFEVRNGTLIFEN